MSKRNLLFSMFIMGAVFCQAQTVVNINDIRYLIEDDHAVVGRQNKELSGDITIPATISYEETEYPVTGIVAPTNLVGVAGGVVGIEGGAFQECQITSVVVPASITAISAGAFCDCTQLASITLPAGLTQIGPAAFAGCTSLTQVEIPGTVTDLGGDTAYGYLSYVFGGCTSLTTVNIPTGVTTLGAGIFMNSAITYFEIPVGITKIEEHALANDALVSVTCGVRDARTINCDVTAFGNMTKIDLQVPESGLAVYQAYYPWCDFKSISGYADEEEALVPDQRHVTIDGVRYLLYEKIAEGDNAREASAAVDIQPTTLEGDITIPESVTSNDKEYPVTAILPTYWYYGSHMNDDFYSYRGAFTDTGVTSVTLPNTITDIGAFAFYRASQLQAVTLPTGIKNTGIFAFSNCEALESVTIPAGVTTLEYGSFSHCSNLKTLTIPEGVTTIGMECFIGSGIETLTIPSTCTSIGYQALELPALKTLCLNVKDMTTLNCTATAFGHDQEQAEAKARLAKVDLIVPLGAAQVYREYYPWLYFRSVTDVNCYYLDLDRQEFSAPAGVFIHDAEGAFNFTENGHSGWYRRDYLDGLLMEETTKITFNTTTTDSWVYLYVYAANNSLLQVDGEELTEISEDQSGTYSYRRYDKFVNAGEHTITAGTFAEQDGVKYPAILFRVEVEDASAVERFEPKEITTRINNIRYILKEQTETVDEEEVVTRTATIARQNLELDGDITVPETVDYEVSKGVIKTYTVNSMVAPTFGIAEADGGYRTTDGAFQDCMITSVSLPATLQKVEVGAFNGCQQLADVTLAEGIEVLGAACFAHCTGLTEVTLPESITDLGCETDYGYQSYVFGGCTNLKKVNTPAKVTRLGRGCFKDSGLETFLIPKNVNELEEYCFATNNLKEIKICHETLTNESITYTESNFAEVGGIRLIVPEGKTSLYNEFYPWKNFGEMVEYVDQNDEHQYNAYAVTYENEVYGDDEEEATAPGMEMASPAKAVPAEPETVKVACYVPSGIVPTLPEEVEEEGYVFMEWKETTSGVMPAADVKVKASMAILGDANKDKRVTITDAVAIVNKILGSASDKFNEKAANVNRDGDITITDAVGVVNIILNK